MSVRLGKLAGMNHETECRGFEQVDGIGATAVMIGERPTANIAHRTSKSGPRLAKTSIASKRVKPGRSSIKATIILFGVDGNFPPSSGSLQA